MADLSFINLSTNDILDVFRSAYFDQYGDTLRIGSEEFAAASIFSYAMSVLFAAMNDSAKQRFLETATGEYLDAIAATYGITERPKGYKATCLVDMTVSPDCPSYAEGTLRISDGSGKVFENARSFSGQSHYSIPFRAVDVGSEYNGIPVNKLVNFVSDHTGIVEVRNITMTGGGTDAITGDDEFRVWLKNEINSFAGAGTAMAYRGKAMNVDSRIIDVQVIEQHMNGYEKGKVKLFVLTDDTVSIPSEVVQLVYDAVSDRAFRPVGDFIECRQAVSEELNVPGTFYVLYPQKFEPVAQSRTQRISDEYEAYVRSKIGRPFVYAELISRLLAKDENGVYATECVVMGLENDEAKPIYPKEVGGVISDVRITVELHFDNWNG